MIIVRYVTESNSTLISLLPTILSLTINFVINLAGIKSDHCSFARSFVMGVVINLTYYCLHNIREYLKDSAFKNRIRM